jgi:hypothetical protein
MKEIIYGKRQGEPCVPLTVRIDWLPDGTIKPTVFRTPDRTCYEVTHIHECIQLAYLKEGGEGLRFKVRVQDLPDTYLYFADNRFCGKNIIDGRYGHKSKEYIPVTLDIFPNGDYEIVCFEFRGTRYQVEKTLEIKPRGAFNAGGVGLRHKVEARQVDSDTCRTAALYLEFNKWFVSARPIPPL